MFFSFKNCERLDNLSFLFLPDFSENLILSPHCVLSFWFLLVYSFLQNIPSCTFYLYISRCRQLLLFLISFPWMLRVPVSKIPLSQKESVIPIHWRIRGRRSANPTTRKYWKQMAWNLKNFLRKKLEEAHNQKEKRIDKKLQKLKVDRKPRTNEKHETRRGSKTAQGENHSGL